MIVINLIIIILVIQPFKEGKDKFIILVHFQYIGKIKKSMDNRLNGNNDKKHPRKRFFESVGLYKYDIPEKKVSAKFEYFTLC